MRKQAESRVVGMCNHFGWGYHKYGDVRYCIHCNQPLPKSERAPDYRIMVIGTWIEAKNSNGRDRYEWKGDIGPEGKRQNQRKFLQEHGGWLFIELGDKPVHRDPAKSGKSAYLVPWKVWEEYVEPHLLAMGMASIRKETIGTRPGADQFLATYRLEWMPVKGDEGRWIPPKGHTWWKVLYEELLSWTQFTEAMLTQ